jgi:hypothetical protein
MGYFFVAFFFLIGIAELNDITIFKTIINEKFITLISFFTAGGSFYLFGRLYLNKKTYYIISGILVKISLYNKQFLSVGLPIFGGYLFLTFSELTIPFF